MKKYQTVGWREWVSLPELGIDKIKAKVDTGARTSALHAFSLKPFKEGNKDRICFDMHPLQHNTDKVLTCVADIIDLRWVSVICTPLVIGGHSWPIEITLTERDTMLFRMLLGRSAIRHHFMVNPAKSFITTK
jgi:hypothetical protein